MADAHAELVADRLFLLGATAVAETPVGGGLVALVADLDPEQIDAVALSVAQVTGGVLDAGEPGSAVQVVEEEPGWDTAWHAGARAWSCGERLLVRPHWVRSPAQPSGGDRSETSEPANARAGAMPLVDAVDRVEVVLDPGATFGAGSHPSTRACLAALEPLAPGALRILDVGCGTGVLGIAALVLGPGRLRAIDVDPAAVAATRRAIECNGVVDRARVDDAALARVAGRFDLVLANLLLPVIEELGTELSAHVAPGGSLVLGGVLDHQLDRAVRAVAALRVERICRDGDWVSVVLTRPDPGRSR